MFGTRSQKFENMNKLKKELDVVFDKMSESPYGCYQSFEIGRDMLVSFDHCESDIPWCRWPRVVITLYGNRSKQLFPKGVDKNRVDQLLQCSWLARLSGCVEVEVFTRDDIHYFKH